MFTNYWLTETERDADGYVEEKLNNALRKKLDILEVKRETELKEKLRKEESEKKNSKQKGKNLRVSKEEDIDLKKKQQRKPSLIDEERKLHEAYQLILREHHRRVNQRVRKKLGSVAAFASSSRHAQDCPCLLTHKKGDICKGMINRLGQRLIS